MLTSEKPKFMFWCFFLIIIKKGKSNMLISIILRTKIDFVALYEYLVITWFLTFI